MQRKTNIAEQAAQLPPVTMDELLKIVDRHFIEKAQTYRRNQRYYGKHREQMLEYFANRREQARKAAYEAEQAAKAERVAAGLPEPEEPVKPRRGRPRKQYVPPMEATGDHEQS